MAQIFYVHCPRCNGKFPCHPELWQTAYDLLCPFCTNTFPQEASPLIITATGERRAGTLVGGHADAGAAAGAQPGAGPAGASRPDESDVDPSTLAESM